MIDRRFIGMMGLGVTTLTTLLLVVFTGRSSGLVEMSSDREMQADLYGSAKPFHVHQGFAHSDGDANHNRCCVCVCVCR